MMTGSGKETALKMIQQSFWKIGKYFLNSWIFRNEKNRHRSLLKTKKRAGEKRLPNLSAPQILQRKTTRLNPS